MFEEVAHQPGALQGIRVLDISTLFAAPMLAAALGDLGADVVKVEDTTGDPLRFAGEATAGISLPWTLANRNKRCISIDLGSEEGRAELCSLADVADVIVSNQPARVLERWGCTYEEAAGRNDRIVFVHVSMFGSDGPYRDRVGNGTIAEGFGGFAHLNGEIDGAPVLPSLPLGDCLAALQGALGAVAACYWRDRIGGKGQLVDVSLYEPVLNMLSTVLAGWQEGTPAPARRGSRVAGGVPRNVYQTGDDEWVVISGPADPQVRRVLELIGLSADDERFSSSGPRLQNEDELDGLVAEWVRSLPAAEVIEALAAARVPATLVNDLSQLRADPHVKERGSIVEVATPDVGTVLMPAPTPRLSRTPGAIRWPGPALDAHRREVLGEWLGS